MFKAWIMTFADRHFGDFVALLLIAIGAAIVMKCSEVPTGTVCVHMGELLVGGGLSTLRLKAGDGPTIPPNGNGSAKPQ